MQGKYQEKLRSVFGKWTGEVPGEVQAQLLRSEDPLRYWSFSFQKKEACGCAPSKTLVQWVVVTTHRVVLKSVAFTTGNNSITTATSVAAIPLDQVSFAGTSAVNAQVGCAQDQFHTLSINSSGGKLEVRAPSSELASQVASYIQEVCRVIQE